MHTEVLQCSHIPKHASTSHSARAQTHTHWCRLSRSRTHTDTQPGSHGRRGSLLLSAQMPNDSFPVYLGVFVCVCVWRCQYMYQIRSLCKPLLSRTLIYIYLQIYIYYWTVIRSVCAPLQDPQLSAHKYRSLLQKSPIKEAPGRSPLQEGCCRGQ